jgi:hypothetical protein
VRRTRDFTSAFLDLTEDIPSPQIFKKWTALSILAGALERKVWLRTFADIHPNLFTVLVGPPAAGKTLMTSLASKMWAKLDKHHLASSSITRASFIDELKAAERTELKIGEGGLMRFHSLIISSDELGVLIPKFENDFMNTLTSIYDGHPYAESRRTKELKIKIEHPQLNFLAGTTPSYLNNIMPEGAWDQGFISRVILVFSSEGILRPIFAEEEDHVAAAEATQQWDALTRELIHISKLQGQFKLEVAVRDAVNAWYLAGGEPRPTHPKLISYNGRRHFHLLKLCMLKSVSRSDELVIRMEDYQDAMGLLLEAEHLMPDIFKAMVAQGDARAMDECWHYVYEEWMKKKEPMPEYRIIYFLKEKVPAHNVGRVLEIMIKGGMLQEVMVNKVGKCYKPAARKA